MEANLTGGISVEWTYRNVTRNPQSVQENRNGPNPWYISIRKAGLSSAANQGVKATYTAFCAKPWWNAQAAPHREYAAKFIFNTVSTTKIALAGE